MENIPKELQSIIVSFLDNTSRRSLRVANTQWFARIIMSDFVFNFTREEQLPQILQLLKTYKHPISVTFQHPKCTIPEYVFDDLSQLTNLTKLHMDDLDYPIFNNDHMLTTLTNLQDTNFPFSFDVMTHFTNLRTFHFCVDYAEELIMTRYTQLENVKLISSRGYIDPLLTVPHTQHITTLFVDVDEDEDIDRINAPHLARYSSLKSLGIQKICKLCWEGILTAKKPEQNLVNVPPLPNLEELTLWCCQFGSLTQVQSTLTSLKFNCCQYDTNSLTALTKLKKLAFSLQSYPRGPDDLQFLTALTNLEWLELTFLRNDGLNDINDWGQSLQFISTQKLTTLRVWNGGCSLNSAQHLTSTLKELTLNTIIPPCDSQLKSFTNLTELIINSATEHVWPAVKTLTQLKKLHLRFTELHNLTDVMAFDKFTELEELVVKGNVQIDHKSIQHLPLKQLTLGSIDKEVFQSILAITTLEALVTQDYQLDDDSFFMMTSLNKLKNLRISTKTPSKLTGVNFSALTSLQEIAAPIENRGNRQELMKKMPYLYYCSFWN